MNGKPVGVRRRVQFLVVLAILAWATQILMQQWGFGAEAPELDPARPAPTGTLDVRAGPADGRAVAAGG